MTGKRRFTDKMQAFCLAYAETANAAEAYRRAYNTEKMATATIGREAYKLLQNPMIEARITELQAQAMARNEYTVDTLLKELEDARQLAIKGGKAAAAVSATMGKAKLLGLEKNIHEHTGKDGGPIKAETTVTVDQAAFNSVLDCL